MIDPISMVAAQGATKIVDRLLNAAMPSAPAASTSQTAPTAELSKLQEIFGKDLKKFLSDNPEIKAQLGDGPYELKVTNNKVTLSGAEGNEITLSSNSYLGQKSLLISEWENSKFLEKGLELQAI